MTTQTSKNILNKDQTIKQIWSTVIGDETKLNKYLIANNYSNKQKYNNMFIVS